MVRIYANCPFSLSLYDRKKNSPRRVKNGSTWHHSPFSFKRNILFYVTNITYPGHNYNCSKLTPLISPFNHFQFYRILKTERFKITYGCWCWGWYLTGGNRETKRIWKRRNDYLEVYLHGLLCAPAWSSDPL